MMVVAAALLVLTNIFTTDAAEKKKKDFYPPFEDGVVWIFQNGEAKVKTADGVEAGMKVSEVPGYLKKYKAFKTTRMTLRPMYDFKLADMQPYAEKLAEIGIHVSVANNEEMLGHMTMPEYRRAWIKDEGDGRYTFLLSTNTAETIRWTGSQLRNADLTVTGDLELMKKWIGLFDGHGVAIFPKEMPYSDAEAMAQAAWKRGIGQVSLVWQKENEGETKSYITLIPSGSKWSKEYPNMRAKDVARRQNEKVSSDYFGAGKRISNPRVMNNLNNSFFHVTDVIKNDKEVILVFDSHQGNDLWLTGITGMELRANGKSYKQTQYEGLKGFEKVYFWSPASGYYVQSVHFEAIPGDVNTVDIYDSEDGSLAMKGLQVSDDTSAFDSYSYERLNAYDKLKTVHIHEDTPDYIRVTRVEFTEQETTFYVEMAIMEPHSFLGHVGSDFTLKLADGMTIKPLRYEGVPVDEDFDRHGDHVVTYFQLVFPRINKDVWEMGASDMTGTICHEPLKFHLVPEAIQKKEQEERLKGTEGHYLTIRDGEIVRTVAQNQKDDYQPDLEKYRKDMTVGKAVDLGLSVLWADMNLGATKPGEMGHYFTWGDAEPIVLDSVDLGNRRGWYNYRWCKGSEKTLRKYNTKEESGTVDNITVVSNDDDAATMLWKEGWRMPSKEEMDELLTKCKWEWAVQDFVQGYKVTGPNGKSIFLPAAGCLNYQGKYGLYEKGYYWTSDVNEDTPKECYYLYFGKEKQGTYSQDRYAGRCIRAVIEPKGFKGGISVEEFNRLGSKSKNTKGRTTK